MGVIKHGGKRRPECRVWLGMKRRCLEPNHPSYVRYGARGITVADAWVTDFAAFFKELGPRPSPRHTLDRIDNTRGYEPGNVRWVTRIIQANNKSDNWRVLYRGQEMTFAQAVRTAGNVVSPESARSRIVRDGWPIELAVETPKGVFKRETANGSASVPRQATQPRDEIGKFIPQVQP